MDRFVVVHEIATVIPVGRAFLHTSVYTDALSWFSGSVQVVSWPACKLKNLIGDVSIQPRFTEKRGTAFLFEEIMSHNS